MDRDVRNNTITRTGALLSLEFALATAAYGIVYFWKMGSMTPKARVELITVRVHEDPHMSSTNEPRVTVNVRIPTCLGHLCVTNDIPHLVHYFTDVHICGFYLDVRVIELQGSQRYPDTPLVLHIGNCRDSSSRLLLLPSYKDRPRGLPTSRESWGWCRVMKVSMIPSDSRVPLCLW